MTVKCACGKVDLPPHRDWLVDPRDQSYHAADGCVPLEVKPCAGS